MSCPHDEAADLQADETFRRDRFLAGEAYKCHPDFVCEDCDGSGRRVVDLEPMTYSGSGDSPRFRDVVADCSACDGSGRKRVACEGCEDGIEPGELVMEHGQPWHRECWVESNLEARS